MGKRVVIVDRAPFMRMSLKDILQKAGHEVVGACDSITETMRLIAQESPDIVITEILVKDDTNRTGIEMTKDILKQYPNLTVMFCTDRATWTNRTIRVGEPRLAGLKGFIWKPFNPEKVRRAVQEALNA